MKTIDDWFQESIDQYQDLIKKTAELCKNAETLPLPDILHRCTVNKVIQQEIDNRDKKLHEVMDFLGPDVLANPLAGVYQRILDAAIRETDKVAVQIQLRRDLLLEQLQEEEMCRKNSFEYIVAINKYKSLSENSA